MTLLNDEIKLIEMPSIGTDMRRDMHGRMGVFHLYNRDIYGNLLRSKRKELLLSLRKAAAACGVTSSVFSGLETGKYIFSKQEDYDLVVEKLEDVANNRERAL